MSETLISAENVSKRFCRDLKKSLWYGVKDSAADLLRVNRPATDSGSLVTHRSHPVTAPDLRPGEFWANKDISFELKRGECLGLIGRNGAGKTTLLKMLNGLIKPDTGRIEMRGRVGALIALGAGFNPILTARENIYINGSILGMSRRQITDRFDEIVDFSELKDSIDAPVGTFSSGMHVRLGFAVAALLIEPDVLLLDEVLAVGDAGFRSRCYNTVMGLAGKAAVILVSHAMPQIARLSTRVLVMSGGVVSSSADTATGIQHYFDQFPKSSNSSTTGTGARALTLAVNEAAPVPPGGDAVIDRRHDVVLRLQLELEQPLSRGLIVLSFFDAEQKNVARTDCLTQSLNAGQSTVDIQVPQCPLTPGNYDLQLILCDASNPRRPLHIVRYDPYCRIVVEGTVAAYTCTAPVLFDSGQLAVR